jgi:hypothetical protein
VCFALLLSNFVFSQPIFVSHPLLIFSPKTPRPPTNTTPTNHQLQYMVVDFAHFVPKQALPSNTLWVVEQSVGLVAGQDMTEVLRRGYWASFNVPAFQEVGGVGSVGWFSLLQQECLKKS